MPTAKLFNMAGDQVGEVALSEAVPCMGYT